ncbi:MAG: hypothetical protein L3J39_16140 [Verrucomicrobiales bacterium]|nr:hypothetical protein [Verrucomicrobiales bacterium]
MTWMLFWKVLFVVVMFLFALMSVLVTIFGAKDIKRLLKALGEKGDEGE